MKRTLLVVFVLGLAARALGCTESDIITDAGIEGDAAPDIDAGVDQPGGEPVKKCDDIGPLHKCVGWNDCPLYNMRAFTCPNVTFVCCVDWTPPFLDAGTDSGNP